MFAKLGLRRLRWIETGIFYSQVGMEFWARWAHKALWHASLWHMHEVFLLLLSSFFLNTSGRWEIFLDIFSVTKQWIFCLIILKPFGLQSHHKPREGPFELNDVFAITNAVPAIALLSYGFFHKGLVPGLCFGAVSSIVSLYLLIDDSVISDYWLQFPIIIFYFWKTKTV